MAFAVGPGREVDVGRLGLKQDARPKSLDDRGDPGIVAHLAQQDEVGAGAVDGELERGLDQVPSRRVLIDQHITVLADPHAHPLEHPDTETRLTMRGNARISAASR